MTPDGLNPRGHHDWPYKGAIHQVGVTSLGGLQLGNDVKLGRVQPDMNENDHLFEGLRLDGGFENLLSRRSFRRTFLLRCNKYIEVLGRGNAFEPAVQLLIDPELSLR